MGRQLTEVRVLQRAQKTQEGAWVVTWPERAEREGPHQHRPGSAFFLLARKEKQMTAQT